MTKTESLPSDKNLILKRQKKVHDTISPHFRLLQFFESHFNATRLASPHIQKIFRRLVSATLDALRHTIGHPLAREIHFHTILFSLRVLRYCKGQSKVAVWKLKDQILSAALAWFGHPPRLVTVCILVYWGRTNPLSAGGLLAQIAYKSKRRIRFFMTLNQY